MNVEGIKLGPFTLFVHRLKESALNHINSIKNQTSQVGTPASCDRPKAYSYIRFSTKRQSKGDSLQRQLDRSRHYAAEFDLDLQDASFEDLGVSAFDGSNVTRGALAAFIQAVESGAIHRGSFLLVENLDRLSRSECLDAMSLLRNLIMLGIRIVTLIDRKILDEESIKDPMSLIWAVMVFVRANEESSVKSDRIRKAHERKRTNRVGFAFGQGPGWLTPNEAKTGWNVVPEKAESVLKVFEMSASGMGSTAIARIANREGWPVPGRAKNWHKTLPHKIVNNRRVLGEFEPSVKAGKIRQATGALWAGYYPAIITEELFNAAQAAVVRRRTLPKRRDEGYHNVFQGFLRCGSCGATFARKSKSSGRNSVGYAIYTCADRERGLKSCSNWNARELESALLPQLMTIVAPEILKGHAKQEAIEVLESERAALHLERKALSNLLSVIESAGGSDALAARIRELDTTTRSRVNRIAELEVVASEPISVVWEEDRDAAIFAALKAVRDVGSKYSRERAELHQSFVRIVRSVWVTPRSHAVLQLKSGPEKIFLPLAESAPITAAFAGALVTPSDPNISIHAQYVPTLQGPFDFTSENLLPDGLPVQTIG